MDFKSALADTLSPDSNVRNLAVTKIQNAASENFPMFVDLVIGLLNFDNFSSFTGGNDLDANIVIAGLLILKNSITSTDQSINKQLNERWLTYTSKKKTNVHVKLMDCLAIQNTRISSAVSQVISAIASIELPLQLWPELPVELLNNVMEPKNESSKQMSLQTIGYLCEIIKGETLKQYSSQILTAIAFGAKKEEKNPYVQHTALTALMNSLEFIHVHFEIEGDRNYLMQVVCEATQSTEPFVCTKALECLVKIAQLYYKHLQMYMEQALIAITINAMKLEDEDCVLQAIEFWSTINEVEIAIDNGVDEDLEVVDDIPRISYSFVVKRLNELVQTLLVLMTQQEEGADDDEWNKSKAAATCLSLIALNVQDEIVEIIVPFVEQNIMSSNWHQREAAIMSFGCILDGPIPSVLHTYVNEALPIIARFIDDESMEVKDACVWTLGRICEFVIEEVDPNSGNIPLLVDSLIHGLKMNLEIVSTCAWALINVAKGLSNLPQGNASLDPYFENVSTALLEVSEQLNNNNQHNSRTSVYEAISQWVVYAPDNCFHIVSNIALVTLSRLEDTITNNVNVDTQCDLCRVLNTITFKVGNQISQLSDRMMAVFLGILEGNPHSSVVIEDCFVCIGTLVISLEEQFNKYLSTFLPYLHKAITFHQNIQLCTISVGIVGDLSRGLGVDFNIYAKSFVELFLQDLNNPKMNIQVKGAIVASFGDIAQAIGNSFLNYLQPTMDGCAELVRKAYNDNNEVIKKQELLSLKISVIQMFTGIVLGHKNTNSLYMLLGYIPQMFSYMQHWYTETINHQQYLDEELLQGMVGLIGDFADSHTNGDIKQQLQQPWVKDIIKQARSSRNKQTTRKLAQWAKEAVKRATQ